MSRSLQTLHRLRRHLVTRFAVLEDKTAEQGQLAPALEHHQQVFQHAPRLVTGNRGVHAPQNERVAVTKQAA